MKYTMSPIVQVACGMLSMLPSVVPAAGADSLSAAPSHCRGVVVNPNGTPAGGATVSLYRVAYPHHLVGTNQKQVGSDGAFDFEIPASLSGAFDVLCAEGSAGIAVGRPAVNRVTLTLHPPTSVRIRLVDGAGTPISGVSISPRYLQWRAVGGQWDSAIPGEWTARTDDSGTAVLTGLPSDNLMTVRIDSDRYVEPDSASYIRLIPDSMKPLQTIRLVPSGTVTGSVVFGQTDKPVPDVQIMVLATGDAFREGIGVTDRMGRYRIPGFIPGQYKIVAQVPAPLNAEWTAVARQVNIAADGSVTSVDLSLIRCSVVKGKVTDIRTGRPIRNILVYSVDPAHPGDVKTKFGMQTDLDGAYSLYVVPGNVTVSVADDTFSPTDTLVKEAQITDGRETKVDFQITAPGPWPVRGIVVDPGGKAVVGALLQAMAPGQQVSEYKTTSDAQGHFSFQSPGLTPEFSISVRAGSLATATPVKVIGPDALTLHVVSGLLCALHGRVTTDKGSPATGASVTLYRWENGIGESVDDTTTDAQGFFHFSPNFAGYLYSIYVKKKGYGNLNSDQVLAAPSSDVAFAMEQVKADSFVAGLVVDRYGHPVSGANVRAMDVDNLHVITTATGRFRLNGVPKGLIHVTATAFGERHASYSFYSGQDDVLLYALSDDEATASYATMKAAQSTDAHLHGNGADAAALLRIAEARATAAGKKVFIVFGATWCPSCYRLSRFLENPRVQSIMDAHYVVLDLDIFENNEKGWENPGGVDLYKKYGGTGSVPFWVFMDSTGHHLGDSMIDGQNEGLSSDRKISDNFLHLIKVTTPNVSVAEMETLRHCLRQMNND